MDIVVKHDTVFKNGDQKPYTGEYKEYYPGNMKISGHYVNGLKHGQFFYFGYLNCDSVVNYSFGRKNGQTRTYEADGYPSSKVNFVNDTLDGNAYYWVRGQLEYSVVYKKGKKNSIQSYPFNESISDLIFYLAFEKNGVISQKIINTKDSIQIKLCGLNCVDPLYSNDVCDTIMLDSNYKVVSFDISGYGTDSYVHLNSSFISGYAKKMMFYSSFGIDILIEAYGVQYKIPGRIIKTIE